MWRIINRGESSTGAEAKAAATAPAAEHAEKAVEATATHTEKAVEASKTVVAEATEAVTEKAAEVKDAVAEKAAAATAAVAATVEKTKEAATAVAEKATAAVAEATGPDGKALFAKCAGCHGADGKTAALGKSAVIAGAADLETKIAGYKAGTLNVAGMGALMKGQVASMSDADIKAVATYISGL